ncbi:heterogeneous nuclear ribonucleoprotein L isoform X3 [Lathamus discolor]|uniref:heterogeneous nuclear ribonucleoprotein L isoform X3 n=1 Tax=Lathamus discolor TaxID=678569 RepID=UPI0032B7BE98
MLSTTLLTTRSTSPGTRPLSTTPPARRSPALETRMIPGASTTSCSSPSSTPSTPSLRMCSTPSATPVALCRELLSSGKTVSRPWWSLTRCRVPNAPKRPSTALTSTRGAALSKLSMPSPRASTCSRTTKTLGTTPTPTSADKGRSVCLVGRPSFPTVLTLEASKGDQGGNPNKRQRQPPLLGDHPAEYGGPHGGYHGHYHDEGYGPPPPHYEGRRMGPPVGGHRRGPSRYGPQYGHPPPPPPPPEYGPHADSPVLMVYGLDQSKMNCDRVFNIFCLYGNVEKVKFMKSKPGAAMVEMADGYAVDRAITHLNNNFMFGQKLNVCVSKQQAIMPGQSYGLEDGSCSYKDFSGSRNNRFSTPEQAAKNRIQHPSNVLHFFNAPLEVTEDNFYEICDELGVKRPSSVKVFSGKSERSSSGLLEWDSKSDALETLGFLNHFQMKNPNGPYPYTLKLCFSTAQHAS